MRRAWEATEGGQGPRSLRASGPRRGRGRGQGGRNNARRTSRWSVARVGGSVRRALDSRPREFGGPSRGKWPTGVRETHFTGPVLFSTGPVTGVAHCAGRSARSRRPSGQAKVDPPSETPPPASPRSRGAKRAPSLSALRRLTCPRAPFTCLPRPGAPAPAPPGGSPRPRAPPATHPREAAGAMPPSTSTSSAAALLPRERTGAVLNLGAGGGLVSLFVGEDSRRAHEVQQLE